MYMYIVIGRSIAGYRIRNVQYMTEYKQKFTTVENHMSNRLSLELQVSQLCQNL